MKVADWCLSTTCFAAPRATKGERPIYLVCRGCLKEYKVSATRREREVELDHAFTQLADQGIAPQPFIATWAIDSQQEFGLWGVVGLQDKRHGLLFNTIEDIPLQPIGSNRDILDFIVAEQANRLK